MNEITLDNQIEQNKEKLNKKEYILKAFIPVEKLALSYKKNIIVFSLFFLFVILSNQYLLYTKLSSILSHVIVFFLSIVPFIILAFVYTIIEPLSKIRENLEKSGDIICEVYDKISKCNDKKTKKFINLISCLLDLKDNSIEIFESYKGLLFICSPLNLIISLFVFIYSSIYLIFTYFYFY